MRRFLRFSTLAAALAAAPALAAQDTTRAPDECFRFSFGAWDPPLKKVANPYNPGRDPTAAAGASGAPRAWAAMTPSGTTASADSVLILFPAWWPSGVTIAWTGARGDTLAGMAHALVADGRLKSPVAAVRGLRIPCAATAQPDSGS